MKPRERTLRVSGTTLLIREWGIAGPTAVFWHALGDHTSLQMVEVGPMLADEFGIRVVGVDAPGFGGSARLPDDQYAMPALVSFAARLLDALDAPRPAWIGASWGAVVGVHVAAEHHDRLSAVVLVDGGYSDEGLEFVDETLEGLQAHWRGQPGFRYPNLDAVLAEWKGLIGRWSPALEYYVRSGVREEDGEIVSIVGPDLFAAALHFMVNAQLAAAQAKLGATDLPVLLLAATEPPEQEERRARSIERFRERLPGADVRRVAAPHLMIESAPEEVARIIGAWLRAQQTEA